MKSLKRTLCLVLALVMVLGLFGIASATSFTDDNTIQYKEAVDVMTGIGAINGMGDGTFNPKGTITRAQAAKLVTYAVLGQAAADKLTGVSSSFTDVTADGGFGWAIPSIEYLVKEGVINGMGDGTFDPNGQITSTATLKMLLCALGYGAKDEYVGNSWSFQVALDANKYGLTDGRTSTASIDSSATREEVALYCFNTIQKDKVQYISTLDIYSKTGMNTIMEDVYASGQTNGLNKQAAEGDSEGENKGYSAFDEPANVWKYKNKVIGAYAVDTVVTYNTKKSLSDVKADLKGYTINADVFTNGHDDSSKVTDEAGVVALTGNSIVVKVFATGTTVDRVVVVKTDVAAIDSIDAARKVVNITTKTEGATTADNYSIPSDSDFYSTVSGLAEGDYVLVTLAENAAEDAFEIVAVSVPTQVTGRVTTINRAQETVTLNGTTPYGIAKNTFASITTPDDATSSTVLWLDGNGYVVASKTTTAAAAKFAYVLDTYTTLTGGKLVNMATVVYTNGSTGDIAMTNTLDDITAGDFVVLGNPNSTGAYTLDAPDSDPDNGDVPEAASGATTIESVDVGNALAIVISGGGEIKATDKALTADAQGDGADAADDYYDNYYSSAVKFIYIKNKTATVLDGVQAVKSIPANSVAIIERHNASDATGVVTAVILPNGTPSGAVDTSKLVYLPATATATTATGALDETPTYTAGHSPVAAPVATTTLHDSSTDKDVKVPVYNAYVNGVQQAIPSTSVYMADPSDPTTAMKWNVPSFYTMAPVTNVTGQYELTVYDDTDEDVKAIVGEDIGPVFETLATIDGVTMELNGATFVDVRTADQQSADPIILTAKGVASAVKNNTVNVSVVYNSKTGVASMVYINKVTATEGEAGTDEVTINFSGVDTAVNGLTVEVKCKKTSDNSEVTTGSTVAKNTELTFTVTVKGTADANSKKDTFTVAGVDSITWNGTGTSSATAGKVITMNSDLSAGAVNDSYTFTVTPAATITITVEGASVD